jgi:hypothetical protein
MKKKALIVANKKKLGRPVSTGIGVRVTVRLHKEQLEPLDRWAAENGGERADAVHEAIRRFCVAMGKK